MVVSLMIAVVEQDEGLGALGRDRTVGGKRPKDSKECVTVEPAFFRCCDFIMSIGVFPVNVNATSFLGLASMVGCRV